MPSRTPALAALAALIVILSGLRAPPAGADGLPVVGVDTTRSGVLSDDGQHRYLAVPDGARTLVAEVEADGGELVQQRVVSGRYSVPGVSLDATAGGLARDGSTLVLIQPRVTFPQARTELVVLDPARLEVRERLTLHGDFSFDALSPDGRTMYLVEYIDPRDPTRYRVRSYDLASATLAPRPIVDASEPGEQMRGYPRTRATGADARWEYTLYDGGGEMPFVHALDTVAGRSICIDMPWLSAEDVWRTSLELSDDGATVAVVDRRNGPVAEIDTASARATAAAAPDPGSEDGAGGAGGTSAIELAGLAIGAACAVALAAMLVRRRRRDAAAQGIPAEPPVPAGR